MHANAVTCICRAQEQSWGHAHGDSDDHHGAPNARVGDTDDEPNSLRAIHLTNHMRVCLCVQTTRWAHLRLEHVSILGRYLPGFIQVK